MVNESSWLLNATPDHGAETNGNNDNGELGDVGNQSAAVLRRVATELMDLSEKRSRQSMVDARGSIAHRNVNFPRLDSFQEDSEDVETSVGMMVEGMDTAVPSSPLQKVSAVLLACMMNMMISIPFGAAYFPITWSSNPGAPHAFPIPGKEALGIRMFLLPTILGQIVVTWASKLDGISFQMVENVPFYHALASVVIAEQGYGIDALGTLFVLFSLSSLLVGGIFYGLGALKLGRVVYFIPSHILRGCIGGIGIFVAITGIQVTINNNFSLFSVKDLVNLWHNMNLFGVVLAFEICLRILTYLNVNKEGRPRFTLLTPLFYCLITPIFYLGLFIASVPVSRAHAMGYFFPQIIQSCVNSTSCVQPSFLGSVFNSSLFDIWKVLNFSTVSWIAVLKAIPTMIALAAFSILHVPINIPAIAISMEMDPDMNTELVAHGYSNALSGLFAGLQNYVTYSVSVVFKKNGGDGKVTSLAVAAGSVILFTFGPSLALYIPRCMAGTLLFHIGLDLFLEGVYDSIGSYDVIEYGGIWLITIVMTAQGMTAALIAGIIAALSTYAVQSITHQYPIRGQMTAESLRSSKWNRASDALKLLEDDRLGRKRILVVQLQGHLFFGNVTNFSDSVKSILNDKTQAGEVPLVVIFDFGLVVGMDSSAAHAVVKLKRVLHKVFNVEVVIFVTGSGEGFPCEYALSQELSGQPYGTENIIDWSQATKTENRGTYKRSGSISVSSDSKSMKASYVLPASAVNRVCESLDSALMFAEDVLIARFDPKLLTAHEAAASASLGNRPSVRDELDAATKQLTNLCPRGTPQEVRSLLDACTRVEYTRDDIIWRQGSDSDCVLLLVNGMLISAVEDTDAIEIVESGNVVGDVGLVHGMNRLTTLKCYSDSATCYRLDRDAWEDLRNKAPKVARLLDEIAVRYLAHRVQHVSNRIFETRCLPI